MVISTKVATFLENASFIRKMFEEGERLRQEFGAENVFDFSLGNPEIEPPAEFKEALKKLALEPISGMHRYMPNAGYPDTRMAVAQALADDIGLPFNENHIVMTCGAGGALNVVLKAILNPGEEIIILKPFFVEYKFYIDNHGGAFKEVSTNAQFGLDIAAIEEAISEKTRGIIINSPNNPTGVVYSAESLAELGKMLAAKEAALGRPIFLISDEPYSKLVFDGMTVPSVFSNIKNSIVVTSHSKDLALPGERIGYVAISPNIEEGAQLMGGLVFCNRTLGFVNAPALMQRLVTNLQKAPANIANYQEKRDILYDNLTAMGYKMQKPQGAFYLFPESPVPNDIEFVDIAKNHRILIVPGTGFGQPGYFRISFSVEKDMILRALPAFKALAEELKL